jgi:hypothetical protein
VVLGGWVGGLTVTAIDLRQTIKVDADLEIRAYYAGHVRLSSSSILMLASPPCGVNPKVSLDGYQGLFWCIIIMYLLCLELLLLVDINIAHKPACRCLVQQCFM